MEKSLEPADKANPDIRSVIIGLFAMAVGLLGLIPALLLLFVSGAISWYGLQFMMRLFGILTG